MVSFLVYVVGIGGLMLAGWLRLRVRTKLQRKIERR
jgi:hypothetical protein